MKRTKKLLSLLLAVFMLAGTFVTALPVSADDSSAFVYDGTRDKKVIFGGWTVNNGWGTKSDYTFTTVTNEGRNGGKALYFQFADEDWAANVWLEVKNNKKINYRSGRICC